MINCPNCETSIKDNVNRCHACGTKVTDEEYRCVNCGAFNPIHAQNCIKCDMVFSNNGQFQKYVSKYPLDFSQTNQLAGQIKSYFFKALKLRLQEEYDVLKYSDYVERFHQSSFDELLREQASELAEESYTIHCKQDQTVDYQIDQLLEKKFNSILDHFLINECHELNRYTLPKAILKYEDAKKGSVDIRQMILDYLDFDNEKEMVYTDLSQMPVSKLKNATSFFLYPEKDEKIFFICDQTVFGSGREGFAMTESAIYWKAHFNQARRAYYNILDELGKEKDWITIDGNFFNANPSLNFKMYKLLQKLKTIF